MSRKGSRPFAAEVKAARTEAVDAPEAAEVAEETPAVPAPGAADRTNGAFGEAPVVPPAAAPSRPTAADLVARVLSGQVQPEAPEAPGSAAEPGTIQLAHGGAHEVGDVAKNPPALSPQELDALAPRLRLPGGATVRREALSSASRHQRGLLVVLSNRTFVAKGVRV